MSEDQGQDKGCDVVRPLRQDKPDTGKLLHLADYETVQAERIMGELRGYWEGLRQGRAIPARAEVEPRGIRRALDYAFILERIAPGAARFRLAGRHLIDLMGMEVRGMPICAFLNTSSRGRFSDVLETVFRGPQIAEIKMESTSAYGRPSLMGHMLFLPLRSDLGDVTRALGCLVAEGEIGQGPRRFDLLSDEVVPVIPGAKIIEPSASSIGFGEAPGRWRSATPKPEAAAATTAPGKATLTLSATAEERRSLFRVVSTTEPPAPRRPRS